MAEKTIFIIDDDPVFRLIASKLIAKSGKFSKFEFYENGYDGLEALKNAIANNKLPLTIFLDIEMPKMNGWQFMEQFSALPPEKVNGIDIYIVTSSIAQEDREKASQYPVIRRYVTKPINVSILNEVGA